MASKTVATPRTRGRALQAIRKRQLSANPLCVACESKGLVAVATQVDHIVALCNGGADEEDNRQGLCDECHKAKTRIDMGFKPRSEFDASGRVVW